MPASPKKSSFFAIISDIHSNLDALEAVLEDIAQWPCRGIFCLGDIIGYGPEPAECVQRMMDASSVTVLGNHEVMMMYAGKSAAEQFGPTVGEPLAFAAGQLTKAQMEWLQELPIAANLDPITLCHASLHDPAEFHYIHDEQEASAHFAAQETFISFHGHTHVPLTLEEKDGEVGCYSPSDKALSLNPAHRYAVNVGSVGQPRDEDPRSCYALYDFEQRLLLHRRVEYDISKAQARFKKAGLPAQNARRLKKGM